MNLASKAYLTVVSAVGLIALGGSAPSMPFQEWQGLLVFAILCGIAQTVPIPLFRSSSVSVAAGVTLAGLVLYGPVAALWINLGSSLVAAFRPKPKPIHKIVFNIANHATAAAVAGAVYFGAGGTARPLLMATAVVPIVLAAIAYFLVQTVIISGIIALTEGVPVVEVWDANFRRSALGFVGLAVISLSIASAQMSMGLLGTLLFATPLIMAWYTLRYVQGPWNSYPGPGSQAGQ